MAVGAVWGLGVTVLAMYWWSWWEWCGVVVETMCGTARMCWWRLMRIDLYGVKAAMLCEILANNKKSHPGPNSFSWIFIFPAPPQDFEIPNFFSGPQ
jgi:hypothetical protein